MMDPGMYIYGGLLTLLALLILLLPVIKYRREKWVSLSAVAVIVLFPLAVAAIYVSVSSYDWDANRQSLVEQQSSPPIEEMVARLKARQDEEPTLEGWLMLGRSYLAIEQFDGAADAYYEAWVLTEGQDPEVNVLYAEALILADRRTLTTSAADLLDNLVVQLPNDPRVLWYGGLSAAARGQNNAAIERWSRLLEADLPENMRAVVQQQLINLGAEVPEAPPGTSIDVTIELDPAIAVTTDENSRLFVIARDADQPMPPVAVKRVRVGEFPVTITISDSDVMMAGRRLADVQNLVLVARISRSGEAFAADGDVYGEAGPATDDTGQVSSLVIIDRTVGVD